MTKKPGKLKFEVEEHESIDDCLARMSSEGYMPVRRMEEPIFQEVKEDGEVKVIPFGRRIVFEGKLLKDEQ
ncbi:NETI motif-containing protein [Bacillus lacus]|uniref:NETI motif-containing protein n=1 Tax=Metabacillus lacus TaxID=1983721 RepID=A0A7X2M0C3_9BACI|nr:NETI motif-containing protein [Metabacillus lacus]